MFQYCYYNKYLIFTLLICVLIFQKKYDESIDVFLNIELQKFCKKRFAQVEFVIWSSLNTLRYITKESNPKYATHCANGLVEYFKVLSEQNDLEKFLLKLHSLTQINRTHAKNCANYLDYEITLALITDSKCSEFDMKNWLHAIASSLLVLVNRPNIIPNNDDQRKELYLKLTQVLLFIISSETRYAITNKIACDYAESRQFLDNCMKLSCFSSSSIDPQYIKCFELLNQFVLGLTFTENEKQDNSKMIDSMKSTSKRFG